MNRYNSEYSHDYYIRNQDDLKVKHKAYREKIGKLSTERQKKSQYKLRMIVLKHYSPDLICQCCGEDIERFLTIDHKNDDGFKLRKDSRQRGTNSGYALYRKIVDEDFPDEYQVYCFNCNCGKSLNFGVCPHVTK